jgi:integrase
LTFIENENREATTIKQYEEHIRLHIDPRLGRERLASLTTPRVHAFRDDLLRSLSRPLAKKVLVSLKAILKDAQRRGDVAQNVALPASIKMASRDKRKLEVGVDIPSANEISRLIASAGALRPILVVATFTGLRSSELRGLTWNDVDLGKGAITVKRAPIDSTLSVGRSQQPASGRSRRPDGRQRAPGVEARLPEG